MSERIYAFLLHLFAPRFQRAYGDEAMQLFRDRHRDEQGFAARLRLWLDLLADLAVSVTREHRLANPTPVYAAAHLHDVPSFHTVTNEPPRAMALLLGIVLSLVALDAFPFLIGPGGHGQLAMLRAAEANSLKQATGLGNPRPVKISSFNVRALPPGALVDDVNIDPAERKRVIDGAIANLRDYYVYPKVAETMADALVAHERAGD